MNLNVLNLSNSNKNYLGDILENRKTSADKLLVKSTCAVGILDTARHYCLTSVLHGVKYLAEPRRSHCERFTWSLVLLFLLAVSLYLLWVTSLADLSNQLLINLGSSNHPIWMYPFPAVTMCPNTKINRSAAEAWVSNATLPSTMDRTLLLEILPNILHLIDFADSPDLEHLQAVLDLNKIAADKLYLDVSIQCQDLLTQCKLHDDIVPCNNLFKTIRTFEGYCCSFNYFGVSFQNSLNVYHKATSITPKSPIHVSGNGIKNGLQVIFRAKGDSYGTLLSSQGIKLLLHEPTNYPDHLAIQRLLRPGQSQHFAINPVLIFGGDDIRDVHPDTRNCYFYNELSLPGIQRYSYKNCVFNCRVKISIELCGCVPFYYPVQEDQLQTLQINISTNPKEKEPPPCGCKPQCNEITYEVATYSYKLIQSIKSQNLENISDLKSYAELNVYFKSVFGTKYQRIAPSSTYQTLANFGGLLGLSFGFSFISCFEIFYSFTIRLVFWMYLKRIEALKRKEENMITYP